MLSKSDLRELYHDVTEWTNKALDPNYKGPSVWNQGKLLYPFELAERLKAVKSLCPDDEDWTIFPIDTNEAIAFENCTGCMFILGLVCPRESTLSKLQDLLPELEDLSEDNPQAEAKAVKLIGRHPQHLHAGVILGNKIVITCTQGEISATLTGEEYLWSICPVVLLEE